MKSGYCCSSSWGGRPRRCSRGGLPERLNLGLLCQGCMLCKVLEPYARRTDDRRLSYSFQVVEGERTWEQGTWRSHWKSIFKKRHGELRAVIVAPFASCDGIHHKKNCGQADIRITCVKGALVDEPDSRPLLFCGTEAEPVGELVVWLLPLSVGAWDRWRNLGGLSQHHGRQRKKNELRNRKYREC